MNPRHAAVLARIANGARMEGFLVGQFAKRYPEAIAELSKWYAEGRLKNQIDLQQGPRERAQNSNPPIRGANFGKQLLKPADPR